jgi:signal transduction histidine kinase
MMEPNDAHEKLAELRHDVRSPLTVITGFADLLANADELSTEVRKDYARRIAAAAQEIRRQLERAEL